MSFVIIAIILSTCLKWIISLGPYSGMGIPPTFGDFEAQRHWLEITSNLPIQQWYTYSPQHWPLDYPPLTAWHSFVLGKVASALNQSWVALDTSKGNEDSNLILFMRLTVIISDLLILVPGILGILKLKEFKGIPILLFLLQPAVILIDNGHFQYNCVMLGFFALSISNLGSEKWILGCFYFVCCILFKQMGLFWSLPIFFYLLGTSFKKGPLFFLKIATVTGSSLFIGFASVSKSIPQVLIVLSRIFPVKRGLWEDKVANFWCASNIFIKIRELFSLDSLMMASSITTLIIVLPSCLILLKYPTIQNFVNSLIVSSLGFFLFSFQVHEKSILIPAFTINLLWNLNPRLVIWFNTIAVYSMMPLLTREGIGLQAILLVLFYQLLFMDVPTRKTKHSKTFQRIEILSYGIILLLLILEFIFGNPSSYPHLFTVLNVEISTFIFLGTLFFVYYLIYVDAIVIKRRKKRV